MKQLFFVAMLCLATFVAHSQIVPGTIAITNRTGCDVYVTVYGYDPSNNMAVIDNTPMMVIPAGGGISTTLTSLSWSTGAALNPNGLGYPILAESIGFSATDNPACATGGFYGTPGLVGGFAGQWIVSSGGCNNSSCTPGSTVQVSVNLTSVVNPCSPPTPACPASYPYYGARASQTIDFY